MTIVPGVKEDTTENATASNVSASPEGLPGLLAANRAAGQPGRTVAISLEAGAIAALPAWCQGRDPHGSEMIICDAHTWEAAGETVEAALMAAGRTTRRLILEPRVGDDHLVCEDGVIRALGTVLDAASGVLPIAVGAGTVNDIVKMASHGLGRDYIVVPTAASMNGYTSLIGAVLQGGIKRTLPAHQPAAIFADLDVLCAAPPYLNQAGFGDLLSKPYSNADWVLSHLIRGVPYNTRPSDLMDDVFARMLAAAPQVGAATVEGIAVLMECILLSGFSMTIAGTSAPASGGEHLMSHYWDMEQLHHGAPLQGLHGTQVGVATRISARLFELLVDTDVAALDLDALAARRPDAHWLDELGTLHDTLSPAIVAEIRAQISQKQRVGDALRDELKQIQDDWPQIQARLRQILMPVAQLTTALKEAGCVDRASGINVPLGRLVRTIRLCRHIRSRYVALDLLDDLGLLEPWALQVAEWSEAPETPAQDVEIST